MMRIVMNGAVALILPTVGINLFYPFSDAMLAKMSKISTSLAPDKDSARGEASTKKAAAAKEKDAESKKGSEILPSKAAKIEADKEASAPAEAEKKDAKSQKGSEILPGKDVKIEDGKDQPPPATTPTDANTTAGAEAKGAAKQGKGSKQRPIYIKLNHCTGANNHGHVEKLWADTAFVGKPFEARMSGVLDKPVSNGTWNYTLVGFGHTFHGKGGLCGPSTTDLPLKAGYMKSTGINAASGDTSSCPIPAGKFEIPITFTIKEWVKPQNGSFRFQLWDQEKMEIACATADGQIH